MLHRKLAPYEIILASASPRRKKLLQELGVKFKVQTKDVVEDFPDGYPIDKVAQYISEVKAAAFPVEAIKKKTIIITADTIVTCGNQILGKPADKEQAAKTLKKLSGKKHQVITGITLRSRDRRHSFSVKTDVYFKNLSDEEINYYITNFEPWDKAGAYGIQEWIGLAAIERIEGSYFNVMGLPTHRLYEALNRFV